jgi:hypothetical protein
MSLKDTATGLAQISAWTIVVLISAPVILISLAVLIVFAYSIFQFVTGQENAELWVQWWQAALAAITLYITAHVVAYLTDNRD